MRVATFVVVLICHALFILALAVHRQPPTGPVEERAASIAFFVEPPVRERPLQPREPVENPQRTARRPAPRDPAPNAIVEPPEPPPQSTAITIAAAPDWHNELQIAANDLLAKQQREHQQPLLPAPHDFSGTTPRAPRKPFGWDHAATHRVEEIPTGGLLININDRCVLVWAILPMVGCRIGKLPVRGDLFDHLKDAPEPQP